MVTAHDTSTGLHVVQVIHALDRERGGPSVTVPALCEALGRAGHRVQLMATQQGETPRAPSDFSLRTFATVPGGARLGVSLGMHRALRGALAGGADVVHSHGLWLWTNLDVAQRARAAGVPHVLSPRGMLEPYALQRSRWIKTALWHLGQGRALRQASCIHVTADSEADAVRDCGIDNPLAVIPNGVAIPPPHRTTSEAVRRLLYVGRLDEKKGIDLLIRGWCQVERDFPEWQLEVIGALNGSYAQEMQGLASDLGAQRLYFRGAAYESERDAHLARAELFVLPTRSENFGMVVAEALAASVPVICSKGAPWPGLSSRGCGFWVDVGLEPLVAALRTALGMPRPTLAAMGVAGRQWMQCDFSWEAQAEKMSRTYEWLVGRGPCPEHVRIS